MRIAEGHEIIEAVFVEIPKGRGDHARAFRAAVRRPMERAPVARIGTLQLPRRTRAIRRAGAK